MGGSFGLFLASGAIAESEYRRIGAAVGSPMTRNQFNAVSCAGEVVPSEAWPDRSINDRMRRSRSSRVNGWSARAR
jgi:hypothetical protein